MVAEQCCTKEEPARTGGAADWSTAGCRSPGLTAVFFSELIPEIDRAKAICSSCPVLEPCLRGAIVRREPAGVWGGQLFVDGRILAHKRARGRPPKVRPPEAEIRLPPAIVRLLAEIESGDTGAEARIA